VTTTRIPTEDEIGAATSAACLAILTGAAPTCTNCGGPLGMSALYCESCIQRDGEPWFAWRDRLATVRGAACTACREPGAEFCGCDLARGGSGRLP
jgi:hypothetical protein